jgi:hypothetical protein
LSPSIFFVMTVRWICLPKSAIADIEAGSVQRQQPGGLLTLAASRGRVAIACISELTLATLCRRSRRCSCNGRLPGIFVICGSI